MRIRAAVLVAILLLGCSPRHSGSGNGDGQTGGDGVGGNGGSSNSGAGEPSSAGGSSGETSASDCAAAQDCELPATVPQDCVEAICDEGSCVYQAKDADGDGDLADRCRPEAAGFEMKITVGTDCDDNDPDVNGVAWDGPEGDGFPDGCNDGRDNDCNGEVDDGRLSTNETCVCVPGEFSPCAYSSAGVLLWVGEQPKGECEAGTRKCLSNGTWGLCTGAIGPSVETCDGDDNDCDGEVDEDAVDAHVWAYDPDGDSFRADDADTVVQCEAPTAPPASCQVCEYGDEYWTGWASAMGVGDCDEGDPAINPSAIDHCDGIDNNCDGRIDDDAVDRADYYCDADGDGRLDGDAVGINACGIPQEGCSGDWLKNPGSSFFDDCDDTNPDRAPGLLEICDGVDNDCDDDVDQEDADLRVDPVAVGTTFECVHPYPGDTEQKWRVTECLPDLADCDEDYRNACETSLHNNPDNCGECGASCDLTCVETACDDIEQVQLGGEHACGIRPSGRVACWGNNYWGQLGDGTLTTSAEPVEVQLLGSVDALALGQNHTCALQDETLYCWGHNGDGRLGNGAVGAEERYPRITSVREETVLRVAAGGMSTCAITTDGTDSGKLWCWGSNEFGQLGNGDTYDPDNDGVVDGGLYPRAVLEPGQPVGGQQVTDAVSVAVGNHFACAVRSSGKTICWGSNGQHQLGDGLEDHGDPYCIADCSRFPVEVATDLDAVEVFAGAESYHACLLTSSDEVWCWGFNASGQVAFDEVNEVATPVQSFSGVVEQVTLGEAHTCVRLDGGAVHCWGSNESGQLGRDVTGERVPADAVTGLVDATDVAAGAHFTCAVQGGGATACWGAADALQLGDGVTTTSSNVPVTVSRLAD